MGHSSPLTTAIYLASDQAEADATIRELGARLGQVAPAPALGQVALA